MQHQTILHLEAGVLRRKHSEYSSQSIQGEARTRRMSMPKPDKDSQKIPQANQFFFAGASFPQAEKETKFY